MRCLLDTNVLVAALLSRSGTPAELLRHWRTGAFELVLSPLLLDELGRVLAYPRIRSKIGAAEAGALVTFVSTAATVVEDPPEPYVIHLSDPRDDYLVAAAQGARAIIVSGDEHLLDMAPELPVYSPVEFLELLES